MSYAIVTDGITTNVIVADEAFAEKIGAFPLAYGLGIGDIYAAPTPPPPTMTTEEAALDMIADHDYRLGLIELGGQI